MNDTKYLKISRADLQDLEELVDLLKRNYAMAEKNLNTQAINLAHAASTLDNIRKRMKDK